MKYMFTIGVVMFVLGVWYFDPFNDAVTYQAPEIVEVEKTVEVDALAEAIKDAQEEKKGEIEAAAKAAYDATYSQEMKKTELEVIKSFGKKLDARQTELEKETGSY